jgi:DNA polymerase III delta prime subunit
MIENTIWVEKYRPDSLEHYVGNDHMTTRIKSFIDDQDIPHLLLAGRAGVGKTTLAKILVKHIECDHLFINASDENSVDTIRNKIKQFVTTIGFAPMKIVVLDEADYISPNAQAALRNLMETFSKNSRFILTCNYQERIIDPIISRCQSFALTPPRRVDVAYHVADILGKENIEFDPKDVKTLIDSYYPDIRKIINTAQLMSKDGKLTLDEQQLVGSDVKLNVLNAILSKGSSLNTFKTVREEIHKNGVRDFSEFFEFLYENLEQFDEAIQPEIILILADTQYKDSFVVDKEINFAAGLWKILSTAT